MSEIVLMILSGHFFQRSITLVISDFTVFNLTVVYTI